MDNKNKVPLQIGVGVLVLIIFFAVVVYSKRSSNTVDEIAITTPTEENVRPTENTNTSEQTPTPINTPVVKESTKPAYRNGTYTAEGTYTSPGGAESISVTLTLANGVIANSSVTPQAENPTSLRFQNDFVSEYKQFVTGKSIADLKLSKVSGSSLTPIGFNNALAKIKAQAGS